MPSNGPNAGWRQRASNSKAKSSPKTRTLPRDKATLADYAPPKQPTLYDCLPQRNYDTYKDAVKS